MIRLLVLLALVVVLWMVASWVLDAARRALEPTGRGDRRRSPSTSASPGPRPERLVACAECGSYVPSSRAIVDLSHQSYCSDRCRRARSPEPPA
jgi:hypothetical protein